MIIKKNKKKNYLKYKKEINIMRLIITFVLIVLTTNIFSVEWFCKEVSSSWMERGVILQACGIGYGDDENSARLNAFDNAQKEFEKVCNKDSVCSTKVVNIDPQRTTCSNKEGLIICHRLFYYYISNKDRVSHNTWEPTVIEIKRVEKPIVNNNYNTYKTTVHQHYNSYPNAKLKVEKPRKYRQYIRTVKGVSIYETNDSSYTGVHLYNPTESEINRAINIGSTSGGMSRIYIHRR